MDRLFLAATVFLISHGLLAQPHAPENLGPRINSSYDDINPVLSPDGKTLFFVRVNHPENTFGAGDSEDIWCSELQPDGMWSEAQRIPLLNIGRYNAVLSVSADGNTLLLNGICNKRGTIWKKRGLSVSTKTGDGWGTPQKLKISKLSKRNRGLKSSGMMSLDAQYIVLSFSRAYNSRKTNLFVCTKKDNGRWGRPRPVKPLNAATGSEDTPFLSADNKTLYFSSDYESKGRYDVYKVTRMGDDWKKWSDTEKVAEVNSDGWDAFFRTNEKGSRGYFSSTSNSMGGADIFEIILFEDNPVITISGKILHATNRRPLTGKEITIMADGAPADSVEINPDSATYRIKLRAGKSYQLAARTEYYKPLPENVDLSRVREVMAITQDLLVEPLPYALVTGRMLDKNSGEPIPASAHPRIVINGMPVDSVSIDSVAGTYSVKLPYGTSYTISAEGDAYTSLPGRLDLTDVDEYREVSLDLQSDPQRKAMPPVVEKPVVSEPAAKEVHVTGTIIDQRTGRPLSADIVVSVKVEDLPGISAMINPDTRTYRVTLPGDKEYTISASAAGYYPVYEAIEAAGGEISRDLVVVPIKAGQLVRMNNIFFETGRSSLKKTSFPELNRITEFLKEHPEIKIEIAGHTDNVGSESFNQRLSYERARSVTSYIVSKGVPSSRLLSKGYGLSRPVASNSTEAGRAKNRRVEFTFLD